ncbi:MAG: flagellar hook-basal body complex protein FliE [Vampirovibrionales bacterium]|nr:flagellar hook-basal body complex protein FliE [Vampirovibrionales bacterium]
MNTGYIPKIGASGIDNPFKATFGSNAFSARVSTDPLQMSQMIQMGLHHLDPSASVQSVQSGSFKDVLNNTLQNVNQTMAAPDALMHEAMTTGSVDVHDVMIANAKSELVVNIAAQMTTKVIQAYDRILQIQI